LCHDKPAATGVELTASVLRQWPKQLQSNRYSFDDSIAKQLCGCSYRSNNSCRHWWEVSLSPVALKSTPLIPAATIIRLLTRLIVLTLVKIIEENYVTRTV
jgi:hypothetical protein